MKTIEFNSTIPKVNRQWVAGILGMDINPEPGPDLIDDDKAVKIKFTLIHRTRNPIAWPVLKHQLDCPDSITSYWGLGKFWLDRTISKVKTKEQEELEKMVRVRELYIVPGSWIYQFKPNPRVLINLSTNFPRTLRNYRVEKGLIHLTEGVSEEHFQFLNQKKNNPYNNKTFKNPPTH